MALDRSLQREARGGRRRRGEREHERAPRTEFRERPRELEARDEQESGQRPGMQRDLEALARGRVELVVVEVGDPAEQGRMTGGGDRQQLRRSVQQAECDGMAELEAERRLGGRSGHGV